MNTQESGQAAGDLLANPLLQDSLHIITSTLIEEWTECKQSELREELWMTLQGQKRFIALLELTVQKAEEALMMEKKFNG